MKKFRYIFLLGLMVFMSSCFEDETIVDEIESTPNLLGFELRNSSISGIADGTEYDFTFNAHIFGPTSDEVEGSYTATVEVDPNSTAEEGVHFRIDDPNIVVSSEGNLATTFSLTLLSEGIETPLDENPVLILRIVNVSGPGNVIASGAPLRINLLYLCPSFLAEHTYAVSGTHVYSAGGINTTFDQGIETITELGPGQFITSSTGHWAPGALAPGEDGFIFTDVCGNLTIEEQNLGGYWANMVEGSGTVDPVTGDIRMEYTVCYAGDCREYVADYVRQ